MIQITVNDIFSITPFRNTVLTFEITGPELAKLLADSLKTPNLGDQMSGLNNTGLAHGKACIFTYPDRYRHMRSLFPA